MADDNLKALTRKRGSCKASMTNFNKYLDSIKNKSEFLDAEQIELKDRTDKLETTFYEFKDIQREIEAVAEDADIDEQYKVRCEIEDKFHLLLAIAKSILNKFEDNSASSKTSVHNSQNELTAAVSPDLRGVKLPTIQLPKFDGSYEAWLEFRDTFESLIHTNDKILNIQKYHYLRASLQGSAAAVIKPIEFSASGYNLAWESVCDRYDNKKLLIHNHIKALFSLEPIQKESCGKFRKLVDDFSKHLRSLEQLKQPCNQWDALLIFMITTKLDDNTLREWEKHNSSLSELPTLTDLKKFLKSRADLLEAIEMNSQTRNKQKPQTTITATRGLLATKSNYSCIVCQGEHSIYACDIFLKKSVNSRWNFVKEKRLCSNCLRLGHNNKRCKMGPCRSCRAWHNSLLHENDRDINAEKQNSNLSQINDAKVDDSQSVSTIENAISSFCASNIECSSVGYVFLSTAIVMVTGSNGKQYRARALLDSGSQSSFITTELCHKLGIKPQEAHLELTGIANKLTKIQGKCSLQIQATNDNFSKTITCYLLSTITNILPHTSIETIEIPQKIQLADPNFGRGGKIDILIGADVFWQLINSGRLFLNEGPILIETALGWIISGPIGLQPHTISCNLTINSELNKILQQFWEVEEISNSPHHSEEELFCENNFQKTTVRDADGRFVVTMPLKQSPESLGDSKAQAERRFFLLEKRLSKNDILRERYVNFMREYQQLGHMTLINDNEATDFHYFTPHHGVLKEESLTTKLRVVFDASAPTTSGLSLNNIQCVGPTIQQDLFSILIRFRYHTYVISADIAKMYRQVSIAPDQRNLQSVVWREKPSDPLNYYKLNTVTYRQASASFLAIRCIFALADGIESQQPKIANILRNDFYVDDLLTGTDTIEEAKFICHQISHILSRGCFPLRKFTSNESNILSSAFIGNDSLDILQFSEGETTKTLGLIWSCHQDNLSYDVKSGNQKSTCTKRDVLSLIAKLYDPLGLVSPCITIPKMLMQRLWSEKLNWDDKLPQTLLDSWIRFREDLPHLKNLKIPRHVVCKNARQIQMHGFSDASQHAYGACIFLKSTNSSGDTLVRLLCSKSKVSPVKSLTIPRLELCGALLLARLTKKIMDALHIKVDNCYQWSDSTVALAWINTSPHNLQTFVANRVSEIQSLTQSHIWRYVPSHDNPADCLSRGLYPQQILNLSLWWSGPPWLALSEQNWPTLKPNLSDLPELKTPSITSLTTLSTETSWFTFERFSQFSRLLRTFAYLLRFIKNCRVPKSSRELGCLTVNEISESRQYLTKMSQWQSFPEEHKALSEQNNVNSQSKLFSLNPFLDPEGIIRVGGRLVNSDFSFNKKSPIVLNSKHPLTKLMFRQEHLRLYHTGPQHLLAFIRETYWPIAGRNLARQTVKQCVICARFNPKIIKPIMGDLPRDRLMPSFPFAVTGIDYAGPFMHKSKQGRGARLNKCYIALFICFTTKAIHLELVSDLSTNSFILALRRFISRRGKPAKLYSDNGRNFVGAITELKRFLKTQNRTIQESCAQEGIEWHLIPPYSPHFGGLWEAGIKSSKFHLKRCLKDSHLTFEEFATVLSQIESVLNSRPLSPLSSDPNDLSPLSPAHFLIGRPISMAPDQNVLQMNRVDRFQRIQQIFQSFWKRWSLEYVCELQKRTKWRKNDGELLDGALVVIKDDNLPPSKWKMGRIIHLQRGSQAVPRVAQIRVQDGIITRSFSKICPLPTSS